MSQRSKNSEKLKPVYLIYGDEYQCEEALSRLKDRVAAGASDVNVMQFSAESDSPEHVLQSASTLPLIGANNLVIVRRFDKVKTADQHVYAEYSANPSPTTHLVLMAEKATKTSVIYKAIEKVGTVHEFKHLNESELFSWIRRRFEQSGKQVGLNAIKLLVEQTGPDLRSLEAEINKVSLYAGSKKIIEESDMNEVMTRNPQNTVFELVDALGAKNREKSLYILNRLFGMGEPPLKVLAMIIRQFRLILKTKCLDSERANISVIAGELRVPPFIAEKYRKQSMRFSLADIRRIYDLLYKTDVAIKTGEMRADLALETLIGRMFT